MAGLQSTKDEPCHPRRHHRRGSRIMDKIITSITCIPKRSSKKRKKHDTQQPLPPLPIKTRQEMMYNISDARDDNIEEMSDSCTSDMTMSPFSDIFSRTVSMTESAESTSPRFLSSISKPLMGSFSLDDVRLTKAASAYTHTPDAMSEATTESEGESVISSYCVSSPLPSTDLVQPKNRAVRHYGSVLAAVSLIASLVRLIVCGENCALLLTSSIAFLVIMWGPMVIYFVPLWNKERYRMKAESHLTRAAMRRTNYAGASMAHAKLRYGG